MVARPPSEGLPAEGERVGLDTNLLIYFLEDHPRYGAWCASLFDRIEQDRAAAVTSTVSLLELVVQPYRQQREELVHKIFGLLTTYPGLAWVPVTLGIADRATELRARYRLSTPDAIQIATALIHQCTRFIGNDKTLRRIKEIRCLILDDLL